MKMKLRKYIQVFVVASVCCWFAVGDEDDDDDGATVAEVTISFTHQTNKILNY